MSVSALPAPQQEDRGLFDGVGVLDDLLMFDAPAFPDPARPGNTLVSLQAFVSLRSIDIGAATAAVTAILSSFGIDVGDGLNTLQERIKLIAAVGLPGKNFSFMVPGCSQPAKISGTSGTDLGMALQTVSLGRCINTKELNSYAVPGFLDGRKFSASVFSSPDSGFGVISDIDDTVKISNVLDTVALIKSTLLEEPKPVPGMPELYTSLAKSLNKPQFVYVTGSPFQLYPFLNKFLDTTYPNAKGPIFTQNLTVVNPVEALQFLMNGNTQAYKVSMVDRLKAMYPKKTWLAIGDSTQKDPEVYGESFRKHGASISCSWIRRVEGANNTDERFAAAFAGVPTNRFRIFSDADIPGLAKINVAGGEC
ncbi:hypothetical protein B0H34DRAFT_800424 [Crassisporium funariophilum]|nr:hypothetical protein B0H34DRAFT_800424 [Crassisporium funariophilum]